MTHCLDLARLAKANGKTAVGSVIVRDGKIISEGIEGSPDFPPILAHAEAIAIVKAIEVSGTRDLSDCSLYTTVEPCLMCSFLIRETQINRVIYGTGAGSIGGATSNYPILIVTDITRWKSVPEVTSGILSTECDQMLIKK